MRTLWFIARDLPLRANGDPGRQSSPGRAPLDAQSLEQTAANVRIVSLFKDADSPRITEVCRRNIVDTLLLQGYAFHGRLDDVTFLGRIWNLAMMPSTDYREPNLEADLRRHIGWGDYDDGEVLYGKLNIGRCPDEQFGRFLSECIHPLVRPDEGDVAYLLALFNGYLGADGFVLVETARVSNRPIYTMTELGSPVAAKMRRYDVALSFAGEERPYVDELAERLRAEDVNVFYDLFEEAALWGRDLTEAFDDVFLHGARFVVMFLSKSYAAKIWPTYERRAAVEGAMTHNETAILPIRFDDTDIPGIRNTVAYVDARERTPEQIVRLILQRLGRSA